MFPADAVEDYLALLRNLPDYYNRKQLDRMHGRYRTMEQTCFQDPEMRRQYTLRAEAIERRFKELDVIDLIGGQT